MLTVYTYQACSTCKDATKWLRQHGHAFQEKAIRETPPSLKELRSMLKATGDLRRLFNTSGMDYRAMGLKDKLPTLSEAEALQLLSEHGNLVKRPFLIDEAKGLHLVGFKEAEWQQALG